MQVKKSNYQLSNLNYHTDKKVSDENKKQPCIKGQVRFPKTLLSYLQIQQNLHPNLKHFFSLPWLMGDGKSTFFKNLCLAWYNRKRIIYFLKTNKFADEIYKDLIKMSIPKEFIYRAIGIFNEKNRDGNILLSGPLCSQDMKIGCEDCSKYEYKEKECPKFLQDILIRKRQVVIAPISIWYLAVMYH